MKNNDKYILNLEQIDATMLPLVGGKALHLAELRRLKDIRVPDGFCITTHAFKKIMKVSVAMPALLEQLSLLKPGDKDPIREISGAIRKAIEQAVIPGDLMRAITNRLSQDEEHTAYAIRSSATAEDLPTTSFAGQQDTYLNIKGEAAICKHISKCWASLFTERAVVYRMQNNFDHRKVYLAVVVQQMVFSNASGILFTADPVTGNRKVVSIDAGFGLGEAFVSGLVNADHYKIKDDRVIDKKVAEKKRALYASPYGGTCEEELSNGMQQQPALTAEQAIELARIGRSIEKHFGSPQDIEWCLANDVFYIVQSRPITTLFPVPGTNDQENHVFVSVGHQQMMTDAMKPLGLSFFLLTTRAAMFTAGGRLFVDVTPMLASSEGKKTIINVLGKSDPLIRDALTSIAERKDFIKLLPENEKATGNGESRKAVPIPDYQALNEYDPGILPDLIGRNQAAIALLKKRIKTKSGPRLFDFILEDIEQLKKTNADSQSFGVIMTGMNAASWINEKMNEWLGEKSAADTISQSVPNNITSEMGLALLDVADAIRPYPQLINYLQNVQDDHFLDQLAGFDGGKQARDAINNFLSKYGMRCSGEIDITKTRWSEKPLTLLPLILSNIKNFKTNAGHHKFEQGLQEALKKECELLDRLKSLPDGEQKIKETKRMIDMVRNFAGYREYPKYGIVSRYFIYKQALLKEAAQLVKAGVIREREDIYYLSFEELREAVVTNKVVYQIIEKRKDEFKGFEKLKPPRIITSDGEIITGTYRRENLPAGALAGLAVSSGIIEGRARVIVNMEDADLEEGDILVTSFTDPSWTPLFVSVKGLVTEVGGLMTHGAVIVREYGLPAVVGVENATQIIKEGQRIRINGTDGYVEIL